MTASAAATPRRLCFVAPGHTVHVQRWVEALADRGHDVLLVSLTPSLTRRVRTFEPYAHMPVRLPKLHHVAAHLMAQRAIDAFAPDVVHMHWLEARPLMRWIARRWPRLVVSVWGRDIIWDGNRPEPQARARRKRALLALARRITATTRFLAERTRPFAQPGAAIDVIPWGVDTERFTPAAPERRRDDVVIGFAKHYAPKYGPDVLIKSLARVRARHPRARVVMIGDRDATPYRRLAAELGVGDAVEFRGALPYDQIPAAMREFDLFCMPSVYESETFGIAAIEASACGIPVVASRVGGVADAVADGVSGLLVPPGDVAALADALSTLIDDRARAQRLGTAGREFVRSHYEWRGSVARMEQVYDELLAS
jgi:glycosyltransferase involved in cell wall biosynthesis